MAIYTCSVCTYPYDEKGEGISWEQLAGDWVCPVCGATKDLFTISAASSVDSSAHSSSSEESSTQNSAGNSSDSASSKQNNSLDTYLSTWERGDAINDEVMKDIHNAAKTGESVISAMGSKKPVISWDDILIKGAQLYKRPLHMDDPVSTKTTIGPNAAKPMVLGMPIFVSHMSYGALSKETKIALAKGAAAVKTATCSGEGGVIPESLEASHAFIFEYVPNKYSVTDENLKAASAIEIKIGQSAKPGMGGHLPGEKVTQEIAAVRGFKMGDDIISPPHFPELVTQEDYKECVSMLRERSGGRPVGIKIAAGHLEEDMAIALFAGVDFITVDGRAGGTGAAPKIVKDNTSIPTIFALTRARKFLDEQKATGVSLIITGGLRLSSDFAKAIALGADAIAVATAAMMAVGCQQYRICGSGNCPVGIATQDPALRARLDVEASAKRVANYFTVCNYELKEFARLTGNAKVHGISIDDICTTNSEISASTDIKHV